VRGDGIPDSCRGAAWQLFTGSGALQRAQPQLYHQLKSSPTAEWEARIGRDISRTFPKHPLFRDKLAFGQSSLFHVLRAYSLYDRQLGYCQGNQSPTDCLIICHATNMR
jgi:hypothetical protein